MKFRNVHVRPRLWAGIVQAALLVAFVACADKLQYSENRSLPPNPEGGFRWPMDQPGAGIPGQTNVPHAPFQLDDLRALCGKPQALSLIRDYIQLGMFIDCDISKQRLAAVQRDFDTVQAASLKSVGRFVYEWGMLRRDRQEQVILWPLEQLEPVLRAKADNLPM
jgi:hypothetical protein